MAAVHPARTLTSALPWRALIHVVGSVVLAAVATVLMVVTPIFLPFFAIGFAVLERHRYRFLVGNDIAAGHVAVTVGVRWRQRAFIRLGENITWRESAQLVMGVAFGAGLAIVVAVEVGFLITLLGAPLVALDKPVVAGPLVMATPLSTWPVVLAGLACAVVFAYINTLIALGHACLTQSLLAAREEELARRVASLKESRTILLDSFDTERRRIERDLHDGVQQKLVDVTLTLGLLWLELEPGNNATSASLVHQAQSQVREAMKTLRNTVRGILPPVLNDHGLIAALRDLAEGSSLNITVQIDPALLPDSRWPARIELAAYYIMSEALTNVARHSGTTNATVRVGTTGTGLLVSVSDAGAGGADVTSGTGLAGLRERAASLGGRLDIRSSSEGTTIQASFPSEPQFATGIEQEEGGPLESRHR